MPEPRPYFVAFSSGPLMDFHKAIPHQQEGWYESKDASSEPRPTASKTSSVREV